MQIGDLSLPDVPVVFYGANTGHDDEAWTLRIGNAVLKRYVVTIDDRRRRIVIETR